MRWTGAEAGCGHAGIAYFIRDRFGKGEHISLGRVVDSHERSGLKTGRGSDVHDTPAAPDEHRRKKQPRQLSQSDDVQTYLAQDLVLRHFRKVAKRAETCIIDENVDRHLFTLQLVEEKFGRGRLR